MAKVPKESYHEKQAKQIDKIEKFYKDKGMPDQIAEKVAKSPDTKEMSGTHQKSHTEPGSDQIASEGAFGKGTDIDHHQKVGNGIIISTSDKSRK